MFLFVLNGVKMIIHTCMGLLKHVEAVTVAQRYEICVLIFFE